MKNVLKLVFISLLFVSGSVGDSYGSNDELMKLVRSNDFWSTYKWGNLEESQLYKSADWKSIDQLKDKKSYYQTKININDKNALMSISTNEIDDLIVTYHLLFDIPSMDNFDKISDWCHKYYGNHTDIDSFTRFDNNSVANKTSIWKVGNTRIELRIWYSLDNKRYIPRMSLRYDNINQLSIKNTLTTSMCKNIEIKSDKSTDKLSDILITTNKDFTNCLYDNNDYPQSFVLSSNNETLSLETYEWLDFPKYTYIINKITGKLVGEVIYKVSTDTTITYKLSGDCIINP